MKIKKGRKITNIEFQELVNMVLVEKYTRYVGGQEGKTPAYLINDEGSIEVIYTSMKECQKFESFLKYIDLSVNRRIYPSQHTAVRVWNTDKEQLDVLKRKLFKKQVGYAQVINYLLEFYKDHQ